MNMQQNKKMASYKNNLNIISIVFCWIMFNIMTLTCKIHYVNSKKRYVYMQIAATVTQSVRAFAQQADRRL